ncbi:MAG TPA: alpha/beta fold hydrolase, partial [Kofleriaceae bacterium]|nr:alpha/beta fold hydrolase [Kofleriaceae bacterium]
EARGLSDGTAPADSVAEMADAYARAVIDGCGDAPVHVLGWSFGGVVALELAHLLARAGRPVASTTLIDAFAPAPGGAPLGPHGVLALFAQELGLAVSERELDAIDPGGRDPDAALARVAELAHAAGVLPGHLGVAHLARRLRVLAANLRADDRHVPRPPPGPVALVRAHNVGGLDAAASWRAQLAELTVIDVPGDHFSMFRPPNVDELARAIDAILGAGDGPRAA